MISIRNNNEQKIADEILDRLIKFNDSKCEWFRNNRFDDKEMNFLVFDDDKLIGGAIGCIKYNWYFLDLLYVDEEYRHQHIGTKLIKEIENLAYKENLTGVRMETWDFQARNFYEKNGYIVFAQIEDCPPNTIDYFLKKKLK